MTKLTIQHEGKTYSWIGDKWGDFDLTDIMEGSMYVNEKGIVAIDGILSTRHTPDQLVKLGYMELQPQEEKPEEEGEAVNGWTPTPGEMIEVSNDGEKWEKTKFDRMDEQVFITYAREVGGIPVTSRYKFARPLAPEELKPLKAVHDFPHYGPDNLIEITHSYELPDQVSRLTTALNALTERVNLISKR